MNNLLRLTKAQLIDQIKYKTYSLERHLAATIEENSKLKETINNLHKVYDEIINVITPLKDPVKLSSAEKLLIIKRKYG